MEIRLIVRKKTGSPYPCTRWDALKGSVWMSGWDERLGEDIEIDELEEGEYIVTFIPGKDGGDSIDDVRVYKLIKHLE